MDKKFEKVLEGIFNSDFVEGIISNATKATDITKIKIRPVLLKEKFKPEFLNRIDEIIKFEPLKLEDLTKIANIQLGALKSRIEEQGLTLEISERAKEFLAKEGYEPLYGARPLRRVIRELVEIPLSKKIIANEIKDKKMIYIDCENDKLSIQCE